MSDSPESVVRKFLAALENFSDVDNIMSFFAEDGVYIDPLRGVFSGTDALNAEFEAQAAMGFDDVAIDLKSLVADGGTVMMERTDRFSVAGKPFSMEVMAAFDIDADGRVKRWRDSYDSKSITDRIDAAGFAIPK